MYLGSSVARCFIFRPTGRLEIIMAFDASHLTLGRSCNAKAKAKANANVLLSAYREELLASEAAERLRDELRDADAWTEMKNAVAAEPSP